MYNLWPEKKVTVILLCGTEQYFKQENHKLKGGYLFCQLPYTEKYHPTMYSDQHHAFTNTHGVKSCMKAQ